MKAEEKARELVERFYIFAHDSDIFEQNIITKNFNAKKCALICVDEKIELIKSLPISDLMKQDLVENELKVKQKINEL